MSYKNPEKQREYQRKWRASRRQSWLEANGPCIQCGALDNLEVDHVDKTQKISHKIWSWSEERRNEELSKCQVLCRVCHAAKSLIENGGPPAHGTMNRYRRHGCRCHECKACNATRRRRQRANKRAAVVGMVYTGDSKSSAQ